VTANAAGWWWWTDQPVATKPIDWAAVGRAAHLAAKTGSEQLRIAEAVKIPIISNNAGVFALMAAMAEFFRQMNGTARRQRAEEQAAPDATATGARNESEPRVDREIHEAATLLGVSLPASVEEIRRAFRQKLIAEQIHPDHGGDEERTRQVIAARDLLVDRCKVQS
jgi:hypothetical protein